MWIQTLDGKWYLCEVRGVVFLTWVNEADKAQAAVFPEHAVQEWLAIAQKMSGLQLQAVRAQ